MPRKSKDRKKLSIYSNSNTVEVQATILSELGFPRYMISFKNPLNNDKLTETSALFRVKHIDGAKSRKKIPKGIKQQLINSTCIIQLDKSNKNPLFSIEIVELFKDKMLDVSDSLDTDDIVFSTDNLSITEDSDKNIDIDSADDSD